MRYNAVAIFIKCFKRLSQIYPTSVKVREVPCPDGVPNSSPAQMAFPDVPGGATQAAHSGGNKENDLTASP